MSKLKVASLTINSTPDIENNIIKIENMVREAAKDHCQWIVLPELCGYHGPYKNFPAISEKEGEGRLWKLFSSLAKELKITIFSGSQHERSPKNDKVLNTAYVFDTSGTQIAKYQKIHLFNLLKDNGEKIYCEADGFDSGAEICFFEHEGFKVLLLICYDLRFNSVFEYARKTKGLWDVLVIPSAFTDQTGRHHWELLLRARAVEYQSYVIASNEVGTHYDNKMSFGHSMIIDPQGQVLSNTGPSEGFASAIMNLSKVQNTRAQIPVFKNLRADIS